MKVSTNTASEPVSTECGWLTWWWLIDSEPVKAKVLPRGLADAPKTDYTDGAGSASSMVKGKLKPLNSTPNSAAHHPLSLSASLWISLAITQPLQLPAGRQVPVLQGRQPLDQEGLARRHSRAERLRLIPRVFIIGPSHDKLTSKQHGLDDPRSHRLGNP